MAESVYSGSSAGGFGARRAEGSVGRAATPAAAAAAPLTLVYQECVGDCSGTGGFAGSGGGGGFQGQTEAASSFVPKTASPAPKRAPAVYVPSTEKFFAETTAASSFVPHAPAPRETRAKTVVVPFVHHGASTGAAAPMMSEAMMSFAAAPTEAQLRPRTPSRPKYEWHADNSVPFVGATTAGGDFQPHPTARPRKSKRPKQRYVASNEPIEKYSEAARAYPRHDIQAREPTKRVDVYVPNDAPFEGQTTAAMSFTGAMAAKRESYRPQPQPVTGGAFSGVSTMAADFPAHDVQAREPTKRVDIYVPNDAPFQGQTTAAMSFTGTGTAAAKRESYRPKSEYTPGGKFEGVSVAAGDFITKLARPSTPFRPDGDRTFKGLTKDDRDWGTENKLVGVQEDDVQMLVRALEMKGAGKKLSQNKCACKGAYEEWTPHNIADEEQDGFKLMSRTREGHKVYQRTFTSPEGDKVVQYAVRRRVAGAASGYGAPRPQPAAEAAAAIPASKVARRTTTPPAPRVRAAAAPGPAAVVATTAVRRPASATPSRRARSISGASPGGGFEARGARAPGTGLGIAGTAAAGTITSAQSPRRPSRPTSARASTHGSRTSRGSARLNYKAGWSQPNGRRPTPRSYARRSIGRQSRAGTPRSRLSNGMAWA